MHKARHTPVHHWTAVLRQQNCQVPATGWHTVSAKGRNTRYCFSKKVGIGIGVCLGLCPWA